MTTATTMITVATNGMTTMTKAKSRFVGAKLGIASVAAASGALLSAYFWVTGTPVENASTVDQSAPETNSRGLEQPTARENAQPSRGTIAPARVSRGS